MSDELLKQSKSEFIAKHAQSKITVEKLDELMDYAMNPKKHKFAWVIHVIKLVSIFLYLFCRKQILDETWEISLQQYEQDRVNKNREVVEDDLA